MLTGFQRFLARTSLEEQLYPPLKLPVRFRPYATDDFDPCVEIYKKNETGRFPDGFISKFEDYLRKEKKTLIVAEHNGRVVGYGGMNTTSPDSAVLCFGIIDPAYQKQRIGTALTLLRIAQIPPRLDAFFVFIFAVDASIKIYSRFGFIEFGKWKSDDGRLNPIGALTVSSETHYRIRHKLYRRGVKVDGNLVLHASEDTMCRVEKKPLGRFRIHFEKNPDNPTPDLKPNADVR